MMKKKTVLSIFFVMVLIFALFGCGTSTDEAEFNDENTLDGYWELDTFNIVYAVDNNTAQKLKELWVDNQIGFRIIEDKMRLYLWAKTPSPELDSGESITEVTDESDCFKIYFSEEFDNGRMVISVYPYIGFQDSGIRLTLYWSKDTNKLYCLYSQDQLYCIAQMGFDKVSEEMLLEN